MIELKDGTNFHNLLLDTKSELWFNKGKEESIEDWVGRIAYQGNPGFLGELEWRNKNRYWIDSSQEISFAVLSFLRRNNIKKEDLEEQLNFELDLSGSYDWRLSEIRKIEEITKLKLL